MGGKWKESEENIGEELILSNSCGKSRAVRLITPSRISCSWVSRSSDKFQIPSSKRKNVHLRKTAALRSHVMQLCVVGCANSPQMLHDSM